MKEFSEVCSDGRPITALQSEARVRNRSLGSERGSWARRQDSPCRYAIPGSLPERHIPGAMNIPHRTMNNATTAHLDKGALIVTYCDGIRCNGSTKGALNMLQLGFRVKELIGGLDCWRYDGYPIDGLETSE